MIDILLEYMQLPSFFTACFSIEAFFLHIYVCLDAVQPSNLSKSYWKHIYPIHKPNTSKAMDRLNFLVQDLFQYLLNQKPADLIFVGHLQTMQTLWAEIIEKKTIPQTNENMPPSKDELFQQALDNIEETDIRH